MSILKPSATALAARVIAVASAIFGALGAQGAATPEIPDSIVTSETKVDSITTTVTTVTKTVYHRTPVVVRDTIIKYVPVEVPAPMAPQAGLPSENEADAYRLPRRVYTDSLHGYPLNEHGKMVLAEIDPRLLDETVIVGSDTVSIILPEPNYGRYDRGLFNFLFIPKGQWMFGITASYGEFNSQDIQLLSLLKDFSFKGKTYAIKPYFSYFFRNNQSIGMRFEYTRAAADLGSLAVDFDDDLNFSISDISYYSQMYTASVFYRSYVGLGTAKRFAIFNEVSLAFGSGASRFKRLYDDEPKDTRTNTVKFGLDFSPGVCVFIMDNVSFNVSFGVFGLHVTHDRQYTNGVDEGTRTSSGANFRFNLFNINFGLGVTI